MCVWLKERAGSRAGCALAAPITEYAYLTLKPAKYLSHWLLVLAAMPLSQKQVARLCFPMRGRKTGLQVFLGLPCTRQPGTGWAFIRPK